MTTVKDSGTRREFGTGAHRDMAEGKGDMVSIPWESILRLSKHYEAGAKKYDRWNFRKGIPVSAFLDSACRHLAKYQSGCDDEDHLSAAAFNVLGAMLMENTKPEMNDLPMREGKDTFPYFGQGDFEAGESAGFGFPHDDEPKPDPNPYGVKVVPLSAESAPASAPAPRPYKIIAVDFDGTLCVDAWPEIGEANLGAIGPLLHRIDKGDKAILWTCREGKYLDAALEWCGRWGIKFAAVNANLPERIAEYGGDCRKCSADEYWDDKAVTVRA